MLPKKRIFVKEFDGKTFQVPKPNAWKYIPVVNKGAYRSLGENWTDVCTDTIKQCNPYCVWIFTINLVKKEHSRKKSSNYFSSKAHCKLDGCECKVDISQKHTDDETIMLRFKNDVKHDICQVKSRKIKGMKREESKKKMKANSHKTPSGYYRSKLSQVSAQSFSGGNRDSVGSSKKIYQNMKAEVMAEVNSIKNLHQEIIKVQEKFKEKDYRKAASTDWSVVSQIF